MATFFSAASEDDGYATTNGEEFNAFGQLYCGDSTSGYDYFTFIRIPLLTVPQGASITSATLTLFSLLTDSPAGSYELVALAEDDSAQIADSADLLFNRPTTLASKSIVSPSLVADSPYDIEDIEALIQEVVSRPGFNGVIQLRLSGFSQPQLQFHSFDTWLAEAKPVLSLEWEAPSAGEYTGSIAVQTAAATVAITGTRTTPAFTGAVSVTTAAATVSLAGTHTPPAYTGSIDLTLPAAEGSISGTHDAPGYTGAIEVTTAAATVDLAGTHTPPGYVGSIDAATAPAEVAIAGEHTPPAFAGEFALTLPGATVAIAGSHTPPAYTGAIAVEAPAATVAIEGTSSIPPYEGAIAIVLPPAAVELQGVFTANDIAGIDGDIEVGAALGGFIDSATAIAGSASSCPRVAGWIEPGAAIEGEVSITSLNGFVEND